MMEVSHWGLGSWSWSGYNNFSLIQPWSKFWLAYLILEVQRSSMSLKSWFGALEDDGSFWLGFGVLILICIWSMVFDTPMIKNFALYLNFESAKNIHVLKVFIWGFGGRWRFLTRVWHFDLDWDRVRNLAWIVSEVLIILRSVKAQIQSV